VTGRSPYNAKKGKIRRAHGKTGTECPKEKGRRIVGDRGLRSSSGNTFSFDKAAGKKGKWEGEGKTAREREKSKSRHDLEKGYGKEKGSRESSNERHTSKKKSRNITMRSLARREILERDSSRKKV